VQHVLDVMETGQGKVWLFTASSHVGMSVIHNSIILSGVQAGRHIVLQWVVSARFQYPEARSCRKS
jgi:hypothetical protein